MDRDQLKCRCCGVNNCTPQLVMLLHDLELEWMFPLHISSGYRCEKHNAAVGGATHSKHMEGLAVDVELEPDEIDKFILVAKNVGFRGIGKGKNFVHIDLGPKRSWAYDEHGKVIAA